MATKRKCDATVPAEESDQLLICPLSASYSMALSMLLLLALYSRGVSSAPARNLCGSDLVDALYFVCGERGLYSLNRLRDVEDTHGFLPKWEQRPRRVTSGIVEQCCHKPCSFNILEGYCQKLALPKPPASLNVTKTTATSVTLTRDSGNPEPEFRVMAVNNIGRGPPSDPVETRTGEQAPSSPPLHVQARMLSASTMLVQWEPPEEPNGQIRGYRVYYSWDLTAPLSAWQKHNTDDSSLTTISGLTPDITYSLRVLGFTSVGDGPPSDVLQVKTQQGVPAQPSSFEADAELHNRIMLTWLWPVQDPITKYELEYWESGSETKIHVIFHPAGSYAVDGLKPDTSYRFSLAARSEMGLGVFTQPIEARTAQSGVWGSQVMVPKRVNAVLGNNVTLECKVEAGTNVTLIQSSWERHLPSGSITVAVYHPQYGISIPPEYIHRLFFRSPSSHDATIVVGNVGFSDVGKYTCKVTMFPLGITQASTTVNVLVEPKVYVSAGSTALIHGGH